MSNRRESLPYSTYSKSYTPERSESTSSSISSTPLLSNNSLTINLVKVIVPHKILNRRIISPTLLILLFFFLYWSNHLSSNYSPSEGLTLLNEKYQIGLNKLKSLRPINGKVHSNGTKKKIVKESIWNNVGAEIELGASLETRLRDWENSPLEGIEASDYVIEGLKVSTTS